MQRETFGSRLGFILVSAACAVGLGNVWRFPFIVGQYGGAAFILLYLIFLVLLGLPILVMEFSVGRASRRGIARAFDILEPEKTKWHNFKYVLIAGNYLLMMFYTSVSGWLFYYFFKMLSFGNSLSVLTKEKIADEFSSMLASPSVMCFWMAVSTLLGFGIVFLGLKRGVERITKLMMLGLLLLMFLLSVRALTLPGGGLGIEFYLLPDFGKLLGDNFGETLFAAMGQAFFTMSLGVGAMTIFGSYIGKDHSLPKEAVLICGLDTFVALLAGLIIIPSCIAFGFEPGQGPGLIFLTLPNVFAQMPFGGFFGAAFFLFLSFAALSTLVAVFENIVAFWMDLFGISRVRAVLFNALAIIILSLPCALGFNVLAGFEPMGAGSNILDLEDFILSNTLLPLGGLFFILFCTRKKGLGMEKFYAEANAGKGLNLPNNKYFKFYLRWILPLIVFIVLFQGYLQKFAPECYAKILGG